MPDLRAGVALELDPRDLGLGARIRQRRQSLGMTLVELADAAGLSHPFLSQIERGQARPSMASLRRVAAALGVSEATLLAPGAPSGMVRVVRSGEGESLFNAEDDRSGTSRVVASGGGVVVQEFADGPFEFLDPYQHPGEEALYVVSGRVEVRIDGEDELVELAPGDAVTYPGSVPHRIRVLEPATRFLMVHTP